VGKAMCVVAAAALLSGCLGEPEKEAPLTMAPGLYEVELPGLALAGFDVDHEQEPTKTLCLRPGDGDFFAHRVVRETLAIEGCGDPVNVRTGNLLSTTLRCKAEDEEVKGEIVLRGSGRIRAEAFAAGFKVDLSEVTLDDSDARQAAQVLQAMQSVGSVSITAKRVGDCPA
jgi:hypothetical protein